MTEALSGVLPGNAAPIMRAATDAAAFPVVPIREIMNHTTTPVAFLPWLAQHNGARFWFSDWITARKRLVAGDKTLAWSVGTRSGSVRHLAYVDGQIVDTVAYPARFIFGRAKIGRTPIGLPAWVARYLVRVLTTSRPRSMIFGNTFVGRRMINPASRQPFDRCLSALRAAKAAETEYRVNFGHMRPITIDDAPPLDGSVVIGGYLSRVKL
jgi:P2-related tail formation protein